MELKFLQIFKERFGAKIFAIVAFTIFVISFSFTGFFFYHQSKSMTDGLIKNNLLLARILSYNSRIGVFSENEQLLRNPVDALFQQEETVEVSIYNLSGHMLLMRERSGRQEVNKPDKADKKTGQGERGIFDKLKVSASPFYLEKGNELEFWSPVVASSGYSSAESLFLEGKSLSGRERIIGFVRITVGKSSLDKKLSALLMNSVAIGLIFLLAGFGITYITVKGIVNPLNTLIKGVQILEKGDFGEKVSVETEDEIGKLAAAFNQMSESLLRREEEKKQLVEQLMLSQRMEAIGTLAGGIAHDFNNILGIIVGYAQMALLKTPENTETHHSLSEIFQASMRARDLVKQILTFSRQDGNQERHPLLVKPLVEEVLKMMRASLPATIEIRHNLKPGLSPILSDPTQIHQVLMNLCTNAGHAVEDGGGVLEVKLDEAEIGSGDPALSEDMRPGRYQVLTVSDTGHGMDAAVRKRIFDPFFTTKGLGKGTGMGLALVHGIVKGHGGNIIFHSEPGKGTTFEVFFPTVGEEVSEVSAREDATLPGRERILFVDDEAALAAVGRQMLQSLGYDVVAKTSGADALEAFQTQADQFDLLITDNTMPHMTGLELVKSIRQIRPGLPVILCTGYSEGLSEEKIKAAGIEGYLMKPIVREKIAGLIRRVLDHGREIRPTGNGQI